MSNVFPRTRWWIALIGLVLLAGTFIPFKTEAQSSPIDDNEYERAILASVKVFILDPSDEVIGTCSGTTVTPDGLILTNFHCVGHTDLYGEDDSGLDLQHGDLYHPDGLVVIAPTKNDRDIPVPTYLAQTVAGSPELDVAVVRIVGMVKQGQRLPNPLPLVTMPLADSDKVKVRDFVGIVGYPGVGGPTITYSEGQIAGFEDQDGDNEVDSFKTNAEIAGGNSGGLAINSNGEQIGIPTYGDADGADKFDRIKMINVALPFLREAGGRLPNNQQSPGGTTNQTPAANTVILKGQIVDADTNRGISEAVILVLKPGVTVRQFDSSKNSNSQVAAVGVTDRKGFYQTSPGLERGKTYTVIVGARGYDRRVFESGLDITRNDAALTDIETIELEKQ